MSYRNPGNLFVGDPNAFMKSFLAGVEKYRVYYEKQDAKQKQEEKELDFALAQFNKNMNYPDIAKTFGVDVANITKKVVNERYVNNGMFASANQQQRQQIYDEISMQVLNPLQKLGTAVKLDPTEIDIFSLEDGTFKDFLKNKVNGFEVVMYSGGPALSFKMPNGATKILMADKIPDKIAELKNKTEILSAYDDVLKNGINMVDYSFRQAEDDEKVIPELEKSINKEATKIYSLLDEQTKRTLFNTYAIESTDLSIRYNDFSDDMSEEEKEEFLQQQDGAILEYIKNGIRQGSTTFNRVRMRLEQQNDPLSNMNAAERKKYLEGQENIRTINKIYDRINDPEVLISTLDFDLTVGTDPVTIENGVVKVPDLLTVDNEIVPAEFDLNTSLGRYRLANYMLEREYGANQVRLQEAQNILRDVFVEDRKKEIAEAKAEAEQQRVSQQQELQRQMSPENLKRVISENNNKIERYQEIYDSKSSGKYDVDGTEVTKYTLKQMIQKLKDDNEIYQDIVEKGEMDSIQQQEMLTEIAKRIEELQAFYDQGKSIYYMNQETGEISLKSPKTSWGTEKPPSISRAELKTMIDNLKRRQTIFGGQEIDQTFAE